MGVLFLETYHEARLCECNSFVVIVASIYTRFRINYLVSLNFMLLFLEKIYIIHINFQFCFCCLFIFRLFVCLFIIFSSFFFVSYSWNCYDRCCCCCISVVVVLGFIIDVVAATVVYSLVLPRFL